MTPVGSGPRDVERAGSDTRLTRASPPRTTAGRPTSDARSGRSECARHVPALPVLVGSGLLGEQLVERAHARRGRAGARARLSSLSKLHADVHALRPAATGSSPVRGRLRVRRRGHAVQRQRLAHPARRTGRRAPQVCQRGASAASSASPPSGGISATVTRRRRRRAPDGHGRERALRARGGDAPAAAPRTASRCLAETLRVRGRQQHVAADAEDTVPLSRRPSRSATRTSTESVAVPAADQRAAPRPRSRRRSGTRRRPPARRACRAAASRARSRPAPRCGASTPASRASSSRSPTCPALQPVELDPQPVLDLVGAVGQADPAAAGAGTPAPAARRTAPGRRARAPRRRADRQRAGQERRRAGSRSRRAPARPRAPPVEAPGACRARARPRRSCAGRTAAAGGGRRPARARRRRGCGRWLDHVEQLADGHRGRRGALVRSSLPV